MIITAITGEKIRGKQIENKNSGVRKNDFKITKIPCQLCINIKNYPKL